MLRVLPKAACTMVLLACVGSSSASTCDQGDEVCEMKTSLLQLRKKMPAAAQQANSAEEHADERRLLSRSRRSGQDPCGVPGQEAACNQELNEEIAKMNAGFEHSKELLNEANKDVGEVNDLLHTDLSTTNFPWNHPGEGDMAPLAPMPAVPTGGGGTGMGAGSEFGGGGFSEGSEFGGGGFNGGNQGFAEGDFGEEGFDPYGGEGPGGSSGY
eukprot:TRINITY_DN84236_c0_g1_i1.p1 TRINITY_DN84236_c0_g1~~TRINITY_DN84236_c0_g1_i1.p1  ORF type:complete len:213 (-),score=51.82 TRINITY_DN84236_c0_g1_i1:183-821(-)